MNQKSILLFIVLLMLTGCVGKREINDLALVMAVGLDKGEKDGTVKVTAQIARPADARGQTGAPAGQTGESIWTVDAEGETIFEAVRNLSSFSSRRVFWAHNFVIVINEDLAKEGIADIIDFFTRNPELRMRTWVVLTPEKASELVATVTGLEVIPGESIYKLFRYSTISVQAPRSQMLDLQSAFLSESSQPVLARALLKEQEIENKNPEKGSTRKQVVLEGAGIFRDDKLVGTLKPTEARGMLLFREQLDSGVVVVSCPSKPERKVSVELRDQNFKVKPFYKKGKVSFRANLQTFASVVEAGCPLNMDNQEELTKLETSLEKELEKEINDTVNKIQKEYKADALELGKVFHNRFPYEWNTIKGDWQELFQEAEVKITVDAIVNHGSLLFEPTVSGKKENIANE